MASQATEEQESRHLMQHNETDGDEINMALNGTAKLLAPTDLIPLQTSSHNPRAVNVSGLVGEANDDTNDYRDRPQTEHSMLLPALNPEACLAMDVSLSGHLTRHPQQRLLAASSAENLDTASRNPARWEQNKLRRSIVAELEFKAQFLRRNMPYFIITSYLEHLPQEQRSAVSRALRAVQNPQSPSGPKRPMVRSRTVGASQSWEQQELLKKRLAGGTDRLDIEQSLYVHATAVRKAVEERERYLRCVYYLAQLRKMVDDRTSIMKELQRRMNQQAELPQELLDMILDFLDAGLCEMKIKKETKRKAVMIASPADIDKICGAGRMPASGNFEDIYGLLALRLTKNRRIELVMRFAHPPTLTSIPLPPFHLGLLEPMLQLRTLNFTLNIYRSTYSSYPSQLYLASQGSSLDNMKQYFPNLTNVRMTIDDSNKAAGKVLAPDKRRELGVAEYSVHLATVIAKLARIDCDTEARVLWPEIKYGDGRYIRDDLVCMEAATRWKGKKAKVWDVICSSEGERGDSKGFCKVTKEDAEEVEGEIEADSAVGKAT